MLNVHVITESSSPINPNQPINIKIFRFNEMHHTYIWLFLTVKYRILAHDEWFRRDIKTLNSSSDIRYSVSNISVIDTSRPLFIYR